MGNFSTKDAHGPTTGVHVDSFHTPPTTPQSNETGLPPKLPEHHPSPRPPVLPSTAAPASVTTGKKLEHNTPTSPSTSVPPPAPSSASNSNTSGPGAIPAHAKPEGSTSAREQTNLRSNGGPPTSTPKTAAHQGNNVAVSPIKTPSQCNVSPVLKSSLRLNWRERDSGLSVSQSLPTGHETKEGQGEDLETLLEECRTTLGISSSQDRTSNTSEILKHLLAEVKHLKSKMKTEQGEWLQFQADLQVAVSVADRLRVEAEEELTALRTAHKDLERELAAAQQRQKKADVQLVTLRGELSESRMRLAALTQSQDKPEPHRATAEPLTSESKEGSLRGRARVMHRPGREKDEEGTGNHKAMIKSAVGEDVKANCRDLAKQYLRNVTNADKSGEEVRVRTAVTERSRSLSRLPSSSDPLSKQNGTPRPSAASLVTHSKNFGHQRGPKSLDGQESRLNNETGKREESLNKYNTGLTELPSIKSQDGFNLLLRRHGGSKRNSLLRWCQNRTQGYENIDITNFSSSWADGLAFCAVYHTYLPSHIPYSNLRPENKKENLNLAFTTGETVGIVQSLTVEEMLRVGGPDWQRVLNYVEGMYRHFEM
ncbi:cytospin-A isoform X1 [Gouania willdenowi]|uniref:Cytospin-A n=1 Tax=Gouania willdenowi TaxID=441366 RepID=A0A8C5GQV2_GOUWI|nr:cytospin-A-like isoform X1 [Gouania willdenowi]XP_028294753.1 cytospin-A-like isoform X1 [Gouania willdenowi]